MDPKRGRLVHIEFGHKPALSLRTRHDRRPSFLGCELQCHFFHRRRAGRAFGVRGLRVIVLLYNTRHESSSRIPADVAQLRC